LHIFLANESSFSYGTLRLKLENEDTWGQLEQVRVSRAYKKMLK